MRKKSGPGKRISENAGDGARPSSTFSVCVVLALAIAVFVLCIPILGNSLAKRVGEAALIKFEGGGTRSVTDVAAIIRSSKAALAWRDEPEAWANLSSAYLLAPQFSTESSTSEFLSRGQNAIEESLSLAPLNPTLWARLGLIYALTDQPVLKIAAAAAMAVRTGPGVPYLAVSIAELALLTEPDWSSDQRELFRRHLLWTFDIRPESLVDAAIDLEVVDTLVDTLSVSPETRAKLEAIFESLVLPFEPPPSNVIPDI